MRTFLLEWAGAAVALLVAGAIRRALRRPQPPVCDSDRLWRDVTAAA